VILKIEGVEGLDGEYPVEFSRFKNREHRTINEISGLGVLQYQEALDKGTIAFLVSIAYIVLVRAGKTVDVEDLWEAEDVALSWIAEEADASPPDPGKSQKRGGQNGTSGEPSKPSTEDSPPTLMPTSSGSPPSDTGSASARETFFSSLQPS
jgi:hypothetical protein